MTKPTNFFICPRNLVDEVLDADMTATVTPVSTLPLSNLKRSSRARVWRSSSASAVDIVVSFQNTTSDRANVVMLGRHNLESAATWRVQMYSTYDASGTALYDSGTVAAYDALTLGELDFGVDALGAGVFDAFLGQRFSIAYFMENTADIINSVRITITDTGNSAGYVEASRLFVGRGIEMMFNWDTLKLKWNEDTKQERSDGGTLMSDGSLSYREMTADLKWIDSTQRADVLDLLRFAGMRRDMIVAARPGVGGEDERDHTMIARMTKMPDVSTLFYNVWSSQFDFAEI